MYTASLNGYQCSEGELGAQQRLGNVSAVWHSVLAIHTQSTLLLMLLSFALAGTSWLAYLGLIVAGGMFAYQIAVLDINDGEQCLALFKSNNRVGLIIFAGLFLSFLFLVP